VVGDDFGAIFHQPPPPNNSKPAWRPCASSRIRPTPGVHSSRDSIDDLHFWLAFDHPFVDGNGRTARALFYWSMLHHEYWVFEYVSISQMILRAP